LPLHGVRRQADVQGADILAAAAARERERERLTEYSAMPRFRSRKAPERILWTNPLHDQYPTAKSGRYSTKKRAKKIGAATVR
jgi:hypothetical protein